MSDTILLMCWVYGDKNPFSVNISREKIVDQLKEAIIAKSPNRFRGIDAYSLDLWHVEIPDDEGELQKLSLDESKVLRPTLELGDCFQGDPPKRRIHIIVKVPGK